MATVLALVLAFADACSRAPRNFPVGGDLHGLPAAGAAPLMASIPPEAEAVVAVRDPEASLQALQQTGIWKRLAAEGWLEDSRALPVVERWRAVQARLSQLARTPLPGPEALLECPAVLAWAPDVGDRSGGFLYVARLDARAASAWSLARALNAVRPSGREVELERIQGIPVREVAFGTGGWLLPGDRLIYAVLADRLLLATDERLLGEALRLTLGGGGHSLGGRAPFSDLESRATAAGFAAAWVPSTGARWVPGIRSVELDGRDLSLQLDPALWSDSNLRPTADPGATLRVGFAGLDLRATLAKLRSQLETASSPAVIQRLEALTDSLGHGLFLEVVPLAAPQEGIAVAIDALRGATGAGDAPVAALASVFLDHPAPPEPIAHGILHCSAGDAVCLASCADVVRLAWPGGYLRQRGCPLVRTGSAADVLLAIGASPPLLAAELRDGRGQLLFAESP